MSNPHEEISGAGHRKYAGVRQRKWVSEIRVPGTHDIAMYCLRGLSASDKLNFPLQRMPSVRGDMSLRLVQKVASDAGMAVNVSLMREEDGDGSSRQGNAVVTEGGDGYLFISVDDYL